MQNFTREVKSFVLEQGMDLVGIASTAKLDELTPSGYNRPRDLLPEAKSTVVMALQWNHALVDGLPELRPMYSRMMIMMNNFLDTAVLKISGFLKSKGFVSLPVHASDPYDLINLKGVLSHKHAAVQAGLGEFGLNNLLLTPQFGPRQRLAQILTDAELEPDNPMNRRLCENMIPNCKYACIRVCPFQYIPNPFEEDQGVMDKVIVQGVSIDKQGCSYFQDRGLPKMGRNGYTYRCGMCINACPVGSDVPARESIAEGIRPTNRVA
jgi:epoxyqueuosine reductase